MEKKFKPFDKVLVRAYQCKLWVCDIFSNYEELDGEEWITCISDSYRCKECDVIPYEGNENLAGTTKNYVEKQKKAKWKPKEGDVFYSPEFKNWGCFGVWSSNWNCFSGECFWSKYGWVFKTPEECEVFCDKLNKALKEVK